jgi:ACT domain-containing protein
LKTIKIQVPSEKMDILDYIQQRGGYVASYIPRERRDTPMTSFTITVDIPEDRQEEVINQIKQLGCQIIDASPDDRSS